MKLSSNNHETNGTDAPFPKRPDLTFMQDWPGMRSIAALSG